MRKIIFTMMLLLLMAIWNGPALAADSIVLSDNAAITDESMLLCLASDATKELTLTGAATDTFAVICNSATVDTITLTDTAEVWFWSYSCSTFKVDWTAVAGSPAGTLTCKGD